MWVQLPPLPPNKIEVKGMKKLFTEASHMAKPFFEKNNFIVLKENQKRMSLRPPRAFPLDFLVEIDRKSKQNKSDTFRNSNNRKYCMQMYRL